MYINKKKSYRAKKKKNICPASQLLSSALWSLHLPQQKGKNIFHIFSKQFRHIIVPPQLNNSGLPPRCVSPPHTPPKGAFLPLPTSPTSAPTVTTPAGSNTTCSPWVAGLHIIMRQVLSSPVGKAAVEVRLSHIQPPQRGSRNKIPRKRFSRASSDV